MSPCKREEAASKCLINGKRVRQNKLIAKRFCGLLKEMKVKIEMAMNNQ